MVRLARTYPLTLLVVLVGLAVRGFIVPIGHGSDFSQWELDARATLIGVNIYAHPPHGETYLHYAYFPLFLYLEAPLMWLALHAHIAFNVLGKLPILAGDLLTVVMIVWYLAERRQRDAVVALGAAMYSLNPLVLYNGAYYGRFDALCVGLFLLALRFHDGDAPRSWRFSVTYAVAVAAKTYPIYILPWLLRREPARRWSVLGSLAVVLGLLSLPYLIDSPGHFFYNIVVYIGHRMPSGETWQRVLMNHQWFAFDNETIRAISYGLLGAFVILLFLTTGLDLMTYCGVATLLFLLLSKVVYEQYFLWPMPFLIVAALQRRSWLAGALLIWLSGLGFLDNEHIHPLQGYEYPGTFTAAALIVAYVGSEVWRQRRATRIDRVVGRSVSPGQRYHSRSS